MAEIKDGPFDGRRGAAHSPVPFSLETSAHGHRIRDSIGDTIGVLALRTGDHSHEEQLANAQLFTQSPTLLKFAKVGLRELEREWLRILNNRPGLSDEGYRRLKAEPVVVQLLADIGEAKAAIDKAEGR